jgi:hypothetical protein
MQLTLKHDMSFSQLRAELPAKTALADDLDATTATAAAQTRADLAKSPGLWQGGQCACWPGKLSKNDNGAIWHRPALTVRTRETALGPLLALVGLDRPPKGAKSDADLHFATAPKTARIGLAYGLFHRKGQTAFAVWPWVEARRKPPVKVLQ